MFDVASREENGGKGSDLIPFWGLTEREDMVKIERIVPMYPFSRDGLAYERLLWLHLLSLIYQQFFFPLHKTTVLLSFSEPFPKMRTQAF